MGKRWGQPASSEADYTRRGNNLRFCSSTASSRWIRIDARVDAGFEQQKAQLVIARSIKSTLRRIGPKNQEPGFYIETRFSFGHCCYAFVMHSLPVVMGILLWSGIIRANPAPQSPNSRLAGWRCRL